MTKFDHHFEKASEYLIQDHFPARNSVFDAKVSEGLEPRPHGCSVLFARTQSRVVFGSLHVEESDDL